MALEIKRKAKESSQNLIRRFSKRMRQSGILLRTRKARFCKRPLSPQAKKRAALRREQLKKEYERLSKLGELKDTRGTRYRR